MTYTICMVLLVLILTGLLRSNAELKDEVHLRGRIIASLFVIKNQEHKEDKRVELSDYTLNELAEEIGRRAKAEERKIKYI